MSVSYLSPAQNTTLHKILQLLFHSRLPNENGGHTFSLTSAEKDEENEVVADGLEVAKISLSFLLLFMF